VDLLLQAGALCSDAELNSQPEGGWDVLGDPTEGALVVAAAKAGQGAEELRQRFHRQSEIPFSSERQWMAVWVGDADGELQAPLGAAAEGSGALLLTKGAPEVLIGTCDRWLAPSGVEALDEPQRQWWLGQARELAARGLRVLAFAAAPHHAGPEQPVENQVLLGLMAQLDPARPEVAEAVDRCRQAGIRPVMITGDHPLTAHAIATGIGLVQESRGPGQGYGDDEVVLGKVLEASDDDKLRQLVQRCSVFARVPPEQKLRIVRALQANGQVVAMTGDGVNDAPALKSAHIGIAMGERGTDVARESADLVLLKDDFSSIVESVKLGRRIFDNLKKGMAYTLAVHVPIAGMSLIPVIENFGSETPSFYDGFTVKYEHRLRNIC
jgi:Ca2+-transporting ATPase